VSPANRRGGYRKGLVIGMEEKSDDLRAAGGEIYLPYRISVSGGPGARRGRVHRPACVRVRANAG
jgi:hypothetical protein